MKLLLCTGLVFGFCAAAQTARTPDSLLESKLLERIRKIEAGIDGALGVAAIDLTDGHVIAYQADYVFPQASSIKIPILIQLFEQVHTGRVKLTDTVGLEPGDAVQGSGHLRLMLREHPISMTVRELATAMMETSDNTATNKLIALVGMQNVNSMLDRMGLRETRLRRIMLDTAAAERNDENVSTPLEMARIVELLYRGKAVDETASKEMIEIMKLVNANFRRALPSGVAIASKPGGLTGVNSETGIIYAKNRPFVLSVASSFLSQAENPVPDVAKLVYEHFVKIGSSNKYGHVGVR